MTEPKVSRSNAKKAVAALSRGKRDFPRLTPREVFPHGLFARDKRDPDHDREMVISATAGVEQALEEAILPKFSLRSDADEMLFLSNTAPLLTDFYDKCRMAYLLGIVGKHTLNDLSIIRHVRNSFAHTRGHLDLDMEQFQNLLEHLTAPDRLPLIMKGSPNQDARERLIQTCFHLSLYLALGQEADTSGSIMHHRQHTFRQ